ncbi:MAG: LamG domain-containing protein, partial [Pedosphaera sp.]|nr:LamG domain-containing protein [Pedosphaera sp.]
MRTTLLRKRLLAISVVMTLMLGSILTSFAALKDGLVSYWPLEEVQGTKTPDLVSGYDMDLSNLTAADLVPGKVGKTFSFSFAKQTLLSRVHQAGEKLPINQHPSFTIAMWAKINATGQSDLRLFSEGNITSTDPLFNLGTHSGGGDASLDVFIRQSGWTGVNHLHTTAQPFDDQWHHIVFVQNTGERTVYVDGKADDVPILAKEAGNWKVNDTSIGGILRASKTHWVTGLIDEVALWSRALTEAEIKTVGAEGLKSVFSPLANGLVSHWPMNEVQGTKTPDVVSGYDMDLNNLTAADLVTGKVGKTFSFSFAKQTLLSRVHQAGEKLPINQHPSFTIAMWAKINATGQSDLRLFSEGNITSTDPLFNLGTHNGGGDASLDVFIRQSGWTGVNHLHTTAQPFDDQWHHIVFVQNTGERTVYVDGKADDVPILAKEAGDWKVNDTSIGGILRASKTHWVTGLIDEVALWSRALAPDEIAAVITSGVPTVTTAKLPLEVRYFTSDFSAAAQGDKVMLRWEATKDASVSIDNGVGNVTANSIAGVGSLEVTINATTTYTLTASRGTESKTAKLTVRSVSGVAAGWRVLEDFENYVAGPILGKGSWKNPEGAGSVIDLGLNKTLGYDAGSDIIALDLKSQTLKQGQKATLFFRMYGVSDNKVLPVTIHVGMTDAPIRSSGDLNTSVGPFVRFEKFDGEDTIAVQGRNGIGGSFDPAPVTLDFGAIYNVWMDIQNDPIETGDVFTVYIQKQGASARTLLFDKYISDRAPQGNDQALGAATPDLTSLFVSAPGGGQGVNAVMFDDFYLSRGAFVNTVPVPPSTFLKVDAPKEIKIASTAFDVVNKAFTLTWGSAAGVKYSVRKADSVTGPWTDVATNLSSAGSTTSYTDKPASGAISFYQVRGAP